MSQVEQQLQASRESLLDQTMRNHLLNFRSSKRRTIRVVDEIPREIFDIMVIHERVMEFLPKPEKSETNADEQQGHLEGLVESEGDVLDLTEEEASLLWELPLPDDQLADRYVDRFLQTALEREALQKRLFYMYQESHSMLEELGYSTLYLALGFLEWTDSLASTQTRMAPLILVPVELERTKVGSSFKLRWTGEDVSTNISLQSKLLEQAISLPEFQMPDRKGDIDEYFQDVAAAIQHMPSWRVVTDINLGFFSFTKFIMYRDLDPDAWPEGTTPADHPLVRSLFVPPEREPCDRGFSEDEVDERLSARDVHHVQDADPSQVAVIEDVKAGRSLVVEGPPGTGKSQTITNIIAELLATGKRVLFVSEKMAALEVVKARLDDVGLGESCLELHSRKSKKKEVLEELRRTIERPVPGASPYEEKFDQLENLKSELNAYSRALREPFGELGRSPFALFSMCLTAERRFSQGIPRVTIDNPQVCDQESYAAAKWALDNLAEAYSLVAPAAEHPWRKCNPGTMLPSDAEEIGDLIHECRETAEHLADSICHLADDYGIKPPTALKDLPEVFEAGGVLSRSKPVEPYVLSGSAWAVDGGQAKDLIDRIEQLQDGLHRMLSKFRQRALEEDIVPILEEYEGVSAKFFVVRLFNTRHRYLRQHISGLYVDQSSRDARHVISDLEELAACQRLRKEVRQSQDAGAALFGSYWRGEESDPEVLRGLAEWIPRFRQLLLGGAVTSRATDIVSAGVSRARVETTVREIADAEKRFVERRSLLASRLSARDEDIFGQSSDEIPFPDLVLRLGQLKADLPKLQRWTQFATIRDHCLETRAKPVAQLVEQDRLRREEIVPCFEANLANALLRLAFKERPPLAGFAALLHEKKIEKFATLDWATIEMNRHRLRRMLSQLRPHISGGVSSGSESGILLGEFARKRRHIPIRRLMSLCSQLIQRIKPCFMMSPLSIAQFLDPLIVRFDVIIFDEASQVRPEDALGALLRGAQVVVMGDTRQLPPTTFFDHTGQSDDDEDEDHLITPVRDIDSILHLCKLSFPSKMLRWHYRSRHESLIAAPNQEFYDNRLLIYPCAIGESEDLGLKFVHLPDTTYDRGHSGKNRKEARAVAEAVMEHYRRFPDRSLGVGAFNIRQQEAILEELEFQRRLYPDMEDFLSANRHEHFFVKNLETIQGDERDVIFLSIGFGKDADGRLSHNFGPLNQEGGERRLNVLVTRARDKCVVFSNFRASDLSLDANASVGLRALKVFLDYAENRTLHSVEATSDDTESPFEDSVCDFVRIHGHEVRQQVGCAGFRVDLAVVNPRFPGRYLLGIECDGAKYHSSRVARDRDRLRQQILEERGWRIHRVWSTDWYRNRRESEEILLDAIERAKTDIACSLHVRDDPLPQAIVPADHTDSDEKADSGSCDDYPAENDSLIDLVPRYECCSCLGIPTSGQLHEQSPRVLAEAVTRVVSVESPVHFDEVVRRIRSLWGLRRAGHRIADAISAGLSFAERMGKVDRRGEFVWTTTTATVPVRRRCEDSRARIDLICDEEIAQAIKLVISNQFATMPDDLVVQCSRALGIQAAHSHTVDRIGSVVEKLLEHGALRRMPNGMIDLAGL